ncbi:unnamed protein product [Rotaria sp. Silwood1]|nr:unnamed protein product [Rotaria sp. Silwood1]CAF3432293.1 unnamed protein product [Rotaria sp. Silwood1]CAF3458346.1 unnamed protein product [Rotaria sp. Silwood1]CAF4589645.1 unnamed protein product [Rotaria sp. Silwood1]
MQHWKKVATVFSTIWVDKQLFKLAKNTKTKLCQKSFPVNMQNFILVWLDNNIDEVNNADCCNTIKQLRQVVNIINTFTDADNCIDFITSIEEENIFMIISGAIGEHIVPKIHNTDQIHSIYVFCQNESKHKQWAQKWSKVRGVFTEIPPICEELKQAVQECDQNSISIGFVSTNDELSKQSSDQMNQSFMYTQILKEILLTIEFDHQSLKDFIVYCREKFANNSIELENIKKLEREYYQHEPIWWYTYECFLYSMLNRALRTMEFDIIIKMGFFIRDLHKDIVKLHCEQYNGRHKPDSFTVYRGQGLTTTDFNQLMKTKGGLLSFNTFLSTSKNQHVSLNFARRSFLNCDLIGVLFVMTIDPSLSSTPFASIKNVSYYQTEREILFSMHSVFRVGHIKQIEHDNDRLWQVDLKLTSDDDPQRRSLTERIRNDTLWLTGWHRLGRFLIMIGHFIKVEDLYKILFEQSDNEAEKAHILHHLGVIKDGQGDYEMAIYFYEKSLEINREILSPDHHFLASSYDGIGLVYTKKHDYFKALASLEKALEIFQKSLSPNNYRIAISYGNIGKVYDGMGEYSKALSYHETALEMFRKTLPETHPNMATSYCDIGNVYDKMGELVEALKSYEKAFEIRQNNLPPEHPLLADSYNRIGELYVKMHRYSKGLLFIEHAIELGERSLPANHPDLQLYKSNLKRFQKTC